MACTWQSMVNKDDLPLTSGYPSTRTSTDPEVLRGRESERGGRG